MLPIYKTFPVLGKRPWVKYPKFVLHNGKLIGKRNVGRLRKRWIEEVEKDLAQKQIIN